MYPKLAKAYPTNKLPDLRGEFIRGLEMMGAGWMLAALSEWQPHTIFDSYTIWNYGQGDGLAVVHGKA